MAGAMPADDQPDRLVTRPTRSVIPTTFSVRYVPGFPRRTGLSVERKGSFSLLPAPAGTLVPAVTVPSPAASGAVVTAEIYLPGEIIPAVSRDYFREKHNYRNNDRPAAGDASGRSCVRDRRAGQDVSCHIPAARNRTHGLNQRRGQTTPFFPQKPHRQETLPRNGDKRPFCRECAAAGWRAL
jgi:hypothetical protein